MLDLDAVLASAQSLKPLPASVGRLTAIVSREDVDLREVVDVVQLDQALTARMLKAANSALSASRTQIGTVKDAVVRLGSGLVLSFAMASSVKHTASGALPGYGLGEGELWRHSVAAALAAEVLKPLARKVSLPPEAFTAALLHDIGKLVLNRFLDQDTSALVQRARSEGGLDFEAAEASVLGIGHGALGGTIAQRWGLPDSIVVGIRFHENPSRSREIEAQAGATHDERAFAVADLVHVASNLSNHSSIGPADDRSIPELDGAACERLGLDAAAIANAARSVETRLEETLVRYG
ncbi:MAG: HDOD domain-containing protein [Planctomycetes bacterium]|nr:HDOD domain-containing protein [Planctomycetota bacterium]